MCEEFLVLLKVMCRREKLGLFFCVSFFFVLFLGREVMCFLIIRQPERFLSPSKLKSRLGWEVSACLFTLKIQVLSTLQGSQQLPLA